MDNAFTAILTWFTDHLAPFLLEVPVVYFTGAFISFVVLGLLLRLVRTRF